jgi:hypothetical protein
MRKIHRILKNIELFYIIVLKIGGVTKKYVKK